MKKKSWRVLLAITIVMQIFFCGCATNPEYYEELTEQESKVLVESARQLALSSNRIPAHLQGVFMELAPYQRILYNGSKRGKATFRWEIYENRVNEKQITQRDINPFWINVYATGDLRDPEWKLFCSQENLNPQQQTAAPPTRVRIRPKTRYKQR